jgi:hypothetical protein
LLAESELNRQVLRVEFGRIRFQAERLKRGYGWAQGAWKWAAPLAGFFFARRFKKTSGAFAKGSLLVSVLGGLWKMWQAARSKDAEPASDN